MMKEFLERYEKAINLDNQEYNSYFINGKNRADFLLFDSQIVCESKGFSSIDIKGKVEKQALKIPISEQNFKPDFYNRINEVLRKANNQIKDSKEVLNYPDALGLVILENLIQSDLSVLSLIDASNRTMLGGLEHIDGVLCLDIVNNFSDSDGKPVRLSQLVIRDTEKSIKLNELLQKLMNDFCDYSDMPFKDGFIIKEGEQIWQTNQNGKYLTYKAKCDLRIPTSEIKLNWKKQLANFLDKWWWIIPFPVILYDWFIR
ncbi:MAG: hypothetical protein AN482_09425 [Anabaena sp. LE011-02]|jgi:hypothetical protein|nr:MAG: hypothetical protein AN482_09425 [Anabaena sp. LE011-02]